MLYKLRRTSVDPGQLGEIILNRPLLWPPFWDINLNSRAPNASRARSVRRDRPKCRSQASNVCLFFGKSGGIFVGYVDSNYDGDLVGGCAVSWRLEVVL
jgi:hypothetical protein